LLYFSIQTSHEEDDKDEEDEVSLSYRT